MTSVEHSALARSLASRSIVLLKNDGVLPLAPATKLALIGEQAKQPTVHGGGSGSVVPQHTSAPFDAISAAISALGGGGSVAYDDGSDPARAAALAARADVALVLVATSSSEGSDRSSLSLDDGALVLACASVGRHEPRLQCMY